jgi:hypothetical protein
MGTFSRLVFVFLCIAFFVGSIWAWATSHELIRVSKRLDRLERVLEEEHLIRVIPPPNPAPGQ